MHGIGLETLIAYWLAELPPPLLDWMVVMPFPAMQSLFDGLLPKGLQWYWKGDFVKTLPDEAKTNLLTPWRLALSASCMVARQFTSQVSFGSRSPAGSFAIEER